MPHGLPQPPVVYSFPTSGELIDALSQFIIKTQKEAVEKKGRFTVAVSGGKQPTQLNGLIGRPGIHWEKWHVFYADERVVPFDDPDSNHKLCTDEFFSKVPIPAENIHAIDTSLLDDLDELSDAYEQELIREFANKDSARFPVFDLILLGMGPDGHTASLFPQHPLLLEEDRWVAWVDDSPKPPPKRITLTFPVINHAARIAFIATGEAKADVLHTVLDKPEEGLPSSRVRPGAPSQVYWFVDEEASAKVEYPKTTFKL